MIDNYLVQQIKDRADKEFFSIVGRYIDLKRCGRYYRGLCPFHTDSHPSLDCYLNDNGEGVFICRSCGKAGDVITFIMEIENVKFDEAVKMLGDMVGISAEDGKRFEVRTIAPVKRIEPPKPNVTIPFELVQRTIGRDSVLVTFLKSKFPHDLVDKAVNDYYLGEDNGWTIYWQIDKDGRVIDGKIMKYNPNGHRVKDEGSNNWVHSKLENHGSASEGDRFGRCLFGEHLINKPGNERKKIVITESEKAAVICSMCYPEYVFVSCWGVGNLKADYLKALEGREVIVFPDAGFYDVWSEKVERIEKDVMFKSVVVSRNMENAMAKGIAKHGDDVADLILATDNNHTSSADIERATENKSCYIAACKQVFCSNTTMSKAAFLGDATMLYGRTWWNDRAVSDMIALGLIADEGDNYLFTLNKCS